MPKISFTRKKFADFEVNQGANLMQTLLEHGVPVASSCSGEGVCSKCKIKITSGIENLQPPNDTEIFLRSLNSGLNLGLRVSCQTLVNGDIEIDANYW